MDGLLLHWAAREGHKKIVELLIEKGTKIPEYE
jgi:ankyrin repeat protein